MRRQLDMHQLNKYHWNTENTRNENTDVGGQYPSLCPLYSRPLQYWTYSLASWSLCVSHQSIVLFPLISITCIQAYVSPLPLLSFIRFYFLNMLHLSSPHSFGMLCSTDTTKSSMLESHSTWTVKQTKLHPHQIQLTSDARRARRWNKRDPRSRAHHTEAK